MTNQEVYSLILLFKTITRSVELNNRTENDEETSGLRSRTISKEHDDYGSAWRQKDLDLVLSKEFRDIIKANNIILIGWKQIRDLMNSK